MSLRGWLAARWGHGHDTDGKWHRGRLEQCQRPACQLARRRAAEGRRRHA